MKEKYSKNSNLPIFLADIRNDLIVQLAKIGLSMQNISLVFSMGISKGGVHKILKQNKLIRTNSDPKSTD